MSDYSIGRHRNTFVIRFRDDGRWVRISLGTTDRGLAEARAVELWAKRTAPVSERIADLWPAYVRERKLAGAKSERWAATWKALEPHFGHRIGSAITRQDCHDYHKARRKAGRADSTVRTELELLRACLRGRYGDAAPAMWIPPSSAPRDRYLTREEVAKLLSHIETPHVRLFVILAVTRRRLTSNRARYFSFTRGHASISSRRLSSHAAIASARARRAPSASAEAMPPSLCLGRRGIVQGACASCGGGGISKGAVVILDAPHPVRAKAAHAASFCLCIFSHRVFRMQDQRRAVGKPFGIVGGCGLEHPGKPGFGNGLVGLALRFGEMFQLNLAVVFLAPVAGVGAG